MPTGCKKEPAQSTPTAQIGNSPSLVLEFRQLGEVGGDAPGAGDPTPKRIDLLAAVAERQSANKKEPEAMYALRFLSCAST
jgi:hypothetical protein